MKTIIFIGFVFLSTFNLQADELSQSINEFVNSKTENSPYQIDQEYLFSGKLLRQFYQNRNYSPAWINSSPATWLNTNIPVWIYTDTPVRLNSDSPAWIESDIPVQTSSNVLGENGFVLFDYIQQIERHGLSPNDYHLDLIEKYMQNVVPYKAMNIEDMMKLDVLLSDAFLWLGLQMYYGKVDSEKDGENWKIVRKEPEFQLNVILEEALATNNVSNALNLLAPRYRAYWIMKNELTFFLKLQEEIWPEIVSDTIIKPDNSNTLLPEIRKRLIKLRYQLSDSTSILYDEEFENQLKLFQKDWGLNSDGVIGKGTLLALNTKPEEMIGQLKVNMERFRWLPLKEPEKYIIVNIANFELEIMEGADTLISMRAIVGKNFRKTPVFDSRMTYIVFGPTWTVPPTILKNDVIPELLKGPEYLTKKNMKLLRSNGTEIAYSDIDWSKISKNNFPYLVRQESGPENALGRVKFMFPNSYNVYIHDTPTRGYFAHDDRALSSGCIRIEKPFELAVILLSDNPAWSPDKIRNAMKQNTQQTVSLKTPVDVILLYLTAWTDGNDRVQFRKDIYNRDEMVLNALNKKTEAALIKVTPF